MVDDYYKLHTVPSITKILRDDIDGALCCMLDMDGYKKYWDAQMEVEACKITCDISEEILQLESFESKPKELQIRILRRLADVLEGWKEYGH